MESTETQMDDGLPTAEVVEAVAGELTYEELVELYDQSMNHLSEGELVQGTVIEINNNEVVVDIGYKSEGLIPMREFSDREGNRHVEVGDEVEVLLEQTEGADGYVMLSKVKAERMRVWTRMEESFEQGTIITGRVVDRIKGGLTVDVGLRAFLPGSLVDIRPVKNLDSFRDQELEFKVISLDRRRNNIVLSRKAVLEKEYEKKKKETLAELKEGVRMQGYVKNITDYGVFVDLGGIDGLLHITDISWGRVNHPSEHFAVGDEVGVVILKFDPETERVSLGYKQKGDDPWTLVDKKYPLGSRIKGTVVSLVDYGAFVEIEEGVEGLIHVSEMSWTKKVVTPSKLLSVADPVECIVSELDMKQRRISLSLRQTESNPWEELAQRFPVGTIIDGQVRNLTEFGAFVEITDDIDGLIHVSDMSWTKRVKHPSEVLQKGDPVRARITNIDTGSQRVSLSIKEFLPNEWQDFVDSHKVGDEVIGKVVNVTDFGLFVDIYEGLEGLAHVSEIQLTAGRLEDMYSVNQYVRARILRVEEDEKKVGLTMTGVEQPSEDELEELLAADEAAVLAAAAAASEAEKPEKPKADESDADAVSASSDADDSADSDSTDSNAAESDSGDSGSAEGDSSESEPAKAESADAESDSNDADDSDSDDSDADADESASDASAKAVSSDDSEDNVSSDEAPSGEEE